MRLTVLMPMGGLGKRFADAGYDTPKPLIDVDGKPMFLRALESFPSSWQIEHAFVIRADQDERFNLKHLIESACPGARVNVLHHNTRGAVETCLAAKNEVNQNLPIIIADCDIRFKSAQYAAMAESGDYDGLLVGFHSHDPRYSFAELDSHGLVVRTAEKVAISEHALLGGYYFASAASFFNLADRFTSERLPKGLKEYYLSHLFNMMLAEGSRVGFAETDSYDIWGTPEELASYLSGRER